MALVAGLFLFRRCSHEDDVINNVNAETPLVEDAAFQHLFVQLLAALKPDMN